ncbi:UNVERIFIED_CONTAM: Retrovirus-related Pol polyprotein from transposon TNT 1-94 [Sesamum latifolium]|uniref:Retrovirus-related Pol polyprotein from transposon TNT 1-94 n=1 Tax=Sesamum latifolium TaxID=2727402 RepID=A0AAW2U1E9_9LAMI
MIAINIEEEHRNQTHKMPIEHQPRANLIVEKQKVNKVGHWAIFVIIKRQRLGKQLSTWLWEVLAVLAPQEQLKGIPSSVSLDDSLASTSIPEHVEKMSNVGVNPSSTSLNHEESDEPRQTLALVYSLLIHQIDVKTTFLYGELEEKIYMDQPEGFVAHGNEHKV